MTNMRNDYEAENIPLTMGELVDMDAQTLEAMENVFWSNYIKVKQALTVVKVIEKENKEKLLADKENAKLLSTMAEYE